MATQMSFHKAVWRVSYKGILFEEDSEIKLNQTVKRHLKQIFKTQTATLEEYNIKIRNSIKKVEL